MKTDCLFTIVSVIKADTDCNLAIDVDKLAEQMMVLYANLDHVELLTAIHQAIITLHAREK